MNEPDNRTSEPVAVEDYGRQDGEKLFTDAFISYSYELVFPDLRISSKEPLGLDIQNVSQFRVINNAGFTYAVQITNLPPWCICTEESMTVKPGEEMLFSLSIKSGLLPPGKTIAQGEIILKRPFIRRVYPFKMSVAAIHDIAIPLVSVQVLSRENRKIRVTVTNGGDGILQGYCYDLAVGTMKKFYLTSKRGENPEPGNAGNSGQRGRDKSTQENSILTLETSYQNYTGNCPGYLILSNCPNPRFRRIEVEPDCYLPGLPFADKPVLHFANMEEGKSKDLELKIVHKAFLKRCSIQIPDKLEQVLSVVSNKAGRICFRCKIGKIANQASTITGFVEFKGTEARRHDLPVAISPA